jgi:SAM-dependent methyltransferase
MLPRIFAMLGNSNMETFSGHATGASRHDVSLLVKFTEDIPKLASEASDLATRLCDTCRNYHFVFPYLRLVGALRGAEDGTFVIKSVIADTIASDRHRILIAGAVDTGLLALVAEATTGHKTNITVLDRCETPLELCRRFAGRWSLPIETLHVDLRDFSVESSFDIIFSHMTLTFIPHDCRLDVLSRLRRSLRPNGRLIIQFRIKGQFEGDKLLKYGESIPKDLIERLVGMNVVLPEPHEAFRRRIEAYTAERYARAGTEGEYGEVERLVEAAGFTIEKIIPIRSDNFGPFAQTTAIISKFLAIVKPRSS